MSKVNFEDLKLATKLKVGQRVKVCGHKRWSTITRIYWLTDRLCCEVHDGRKPHSVLAEELSIEGPCPPSH